MKKMERLSWLIFFLLCYTGISAQSKKIDSLKSVMALSGKPDNFLTPFELAYELFDVDNVQAVEYAKISYERALRAGDTIYIVKVGRIYGQLLRRIDKLEEAIGVLNFVLPIAQRHDRIQDLTLALNSLAGVHILRADFDKALAYYFRQVTVLEDRHQSESLAISFNNIGVLYYQLNDPENALVYYQKSLRLKVQNKDSFDLDRLYINIGLAYCVLLNYTEALIFFNKGYSVCSPNCSNQIRIEADHGTGVAFLLAKKKHLAKLYFEKSLKIARMESSQRFQLENLVKLLDISLESHQFANAHLYLKQIEDLPERNNYTEPMIEVNGICAKLYKEEKDYKTALTFQLKYSALKDLVFDTKIRNNFMKVHAQFAERDNLEKIASQTKLLSMQKDAIENQAIINVLFGTCLILTLGFAVILVKRVNQKQKMN